jgi:hypothetical protein
MVVAMAQLARASVLTPVLALVVMVVVVVVVGPHQMATRSIRVELPHGRCVLEP